jgi:predicted nucleic acid-binding protein
MRSTITSRGQTVVPAAIRERFRLRPATRWLLDTSALLALRDNEAGAGHVAAIKACHALSVADAWIAAAAQQEGAVLVQKDPEFQAINSLAQEWLA